MASQLSSNLDWSLANNIWAQTLNPLIANPTNSIQILQNIVLIAGKNIINHKLGRQMQGWFLTDVQGAMTDYPYRSAPMNNLTLTLTSTVNVTVNIGVF